MSAIPLAYSDKRFLLTCPVCGSGSWDRDGSEFQCSWYYARLAVVNDTYFHQVLLYVHDCKADSPGDATCGPER